LEEKFNKFQNKKIFLKKQIEKNYKIEIKMIKEEKEGR